MTRKSGRRRGLRNLRVKSDSSDRIPSASTITLTHTNMVGSTFSGVTFQICSPASSFFGTHLVNNALLYQKFKIREMEVVMFPNGTANLAMAYSPNILESAQTLTSMRSMQVSAYYPSTLVAKPLKMFVDNRSMNRGQFRSYYCWAAANSDFNISEQFQGYLYFYQSTSATVQIQITTKITFFDPIDYNLGETGTSHLKIVMIKDPPNNPLPIEPADAHDDRSDEKAGVGPPSDLKQLRAPVLDLPHDESGENLESKQRDRPRIRQKVDLEKFRRLFELWTEENDTMVRVNQEDEVKSLNLVTQ